MAEYNIYPAVDEDYNFPPEVRQAISESVEVKNVIEEKRQLQTFRWPNEAAKLLETTMLEGDVGYLADSNSEYVYIDNVWIRQPRIFRWVLETEIATQTLMQDGDRGFVTSNNNEYIFDGAVWVRQPRRYVWATIADKTNQTGMKLGDTGVLATDASQYVYSGTAWLENTFTESTPDYNLIRKSGTFKDGINGPPGQAVLQSFYLNDNYQVQVAYEIARGVGRTPNGWFRQMDTGIWSAWAPMSGVYSVASVYHLATIAQNREPGDRVIAAGESGHGYDSRWVWQGGVWLLDGMIVGDSAYLGGVSNLVNADPVVEIRKGTFAYDMERANHLVWMDTGWGWLA